MLWKLSRISRAVIFGGNNENSMSRDVIVVEKRKQK